MQAYFHFLKKNFSPVIFGWLLTFFSSFGQTFLISIYVPFILSELALSKSAFGFYYAGATIAASFFLLKFGHIIDERPIRPFTNKVIILLAVSCLLLAFVWHPLALFVVLMGLRLGGQSLMSHISLSTMSRYFEKNRGKALSLSSLGYPMGEMIFPLLIGGLIILGGWRIAALASALILLGLLLPVIHTMNIERLDKAHGISDKTDNLPKRKFFLQMLKEKRFWVIAPAVFSISFIITGFFFFQFVLAAEKKWPLELYTLLFTGYGGVRLFFSLYGGILTDRFSAAMLFPFFLIPIALGIGSIAVIPGLSGGAIFLLLTGISVGLSGVVQSTVIADIYGIDKIGQVRSLYTVVMVLSTSVAPLIFGICLDANVSFDVIAIICAILMLLITMHNFRIRNLKKEKYEIY